MYYSKENVMLLIFDEIRKHLNQELCPFVYCPEDVDRDIAALMIALSYRPCTYSMISSSSDAKGKEKGREKEKEKGQGIAFKKRRQRLRECEGDVAQCLQKELELRFDSRLVPATWFLRLLLPISGGGGGGGIDWIPYEWQKVRHLLRFHVDFDSNSSNDGRKEGIEDLIQNKIKESKEKKEPRLCLDLGELALTEKIKKEEDGEEEKKEGANCLSQ